MNIQLDNFGVNPMKVFPKRDVPSIELMEREGAPFNPNALVSGFRQDDGRGGLNGPDRHSPIKLGLYEESNARYTEKASIGNHEP